MKRIAACILGIIMMVNLICVCTPQSVLGAVSNYYVRIGLSSTYADKSSIHINNTALTIGYFVDGSFKAGSTITSSEGFTFTPDNSSYVCLGSEYSSYDSAALAIKSYAAEIPLYVAAIGDGKYKIYAASEYEGTLSSQAAAVDTVSCSEDICDVSYRIKVTFTDGTMIIDVQGDLLYPQFKAGLANSDGDYVVDLGDRSYRGMIEIGRYGKSSLLTAVNEIMLEDYLYGVIPCEMTSSWEMEALKAQAVCARSYAYAIDKRSVVFNADYGYAIYDTTKSQVYKGYNYENSRTNEAVDATSGLMIYFRDNVVKAYYYSTSGGHTASCEDVWDVPLTYFRGVNDNTELYVEKKPWIVAITKSQLSSYVDVGSVTGVTAQIKSDSGRIFQLKITGTQANTVLKKEQISSVLSLPSTKVKIIKYGDVPDEVYIKGQTESVKSRISSSYVISGDGTVSAVSDDIEQYIVISEDNLTNFPKDAPTDPDTFYFAGMGYGHGVGLSQSGAQSMAQLGYNYEEIINHYYNKVEIR